MSHQPLCGIKGPGMLVSIHSTTTPDAQHLPGSTHTISITMKNAVYTLRRTAMPVTKIPRENDRQVQHTVASKHNSFNKVWASAATPRASPRCNARRGVRKELYKSIATYSTVALTPINGPLCNVSQDALAGVAKRYAAFHPHFGDSAVNNLVVMYSELRSASVNCYLARVNPDVVRKAELRNKLESTIEVRFASSLAAAKKCFTNSQVEQLEHEVDTNSSTHSACADAQGFLGVKITSHGGSPRYHTAVYAIHARPTAKGAQ